MMQLPYETVLVPVDFSDPSLFTVELVRKALGGSGVLHVLTVLEHPHVADPVAVWGDVHDKDRIAKAEKALRERIGDDAQVRLHTRIGNPAIRIVEVAEEIGADLVALPTHGRTGASRMLIGSVAERVARLAPCPVLILRRLGKSGT